MRWTSGTSMTAFTILIIGQAIAPDRVLAEGFLRVNLAYDATARDGAEKPSASLFLGPSVGFDAFVYDTDSKQYRAGIIPGVGYGLKWKPKFWTKSDSFLALDIFVAAAFDDDDAAHSGPDHFDIDVLPVLTFVDWLSIGFGQRFQLGLDTVDSARHGIFSFGLRKSI